MIQWTFLQRRAAATKSPVLRCCHFERKSPWWMQPPVDFKPSNVKLLLLLSPVLGTSSHNSFTVTHWLVGIVIIWFPIGFEVASLQQISSFWQLEYSCIERDSIITEWWQWELLIPTCFLVTQICSVEPALLHLTMYLSYKTHLWQQGRDKYQSLCQRAFHPISQEVQARCWDISSDPCCSSAGPPTEVC